MGININGTLITKATVSSSAEILSTPTIVTDGLVLWLDAGNDYSYISSSNYYDCGYGRQYYAADPGCPKCNTKLMDISGYGNDGVLTGGAVVLYDTGSGFVRINNAAHYIASGTGSAINDLTALTVSTWFKVPSVAIGQTLAYKSNNNAGAGWFQEMATATTDIGLSISYSTGNVKSYIARSNIPAGQWVNFTSTWSGGATAASITNYVNAKSYATSVAVDGTGVHSTDAAQPLELCRARTGATGSFSGSMAVMLVYNRALTVDEISQNYNTVRSRFGI